MGRGNGRRCDRERSTIVQDLLDVLSVSFSIDDIVVTGGGLPQHNTTEVLGVLVHVSLDKGLHLVGGQVESSISSSRRSGKTDEELSIGVGALLDDTDPLIEVELARAVDVVRSRATLGVVELNPEEIKVRVGNSVAELSIGDGALGSTRDVVGLLGARGVMLAQTIDHGGVSWIGVLERVRSGS